ncbi:MAG: orotidine-5'-phosphate decarboxylase [Salinibacter sp.]
MSTSFSSRLQHIQSQKDTAVCVGLDPVPARLPAPLQDGRLRTDAVRAFCSSIVEATAPYACAFKPNFAFFEALGPAGLTVLDQVVSTIPDDCLLIGDAKRGDIGHSAQFYAASLYDDFGFDGCTVSPYLGGDSVSPFLEHGGTCTFVLARTSNDGAAALQEACTCDGTPLYRHVAQKTTAWEDGEDGEAGLVVGATAPDALSPLRADAPTLPFLVPGVGAQGGDPAAVMDAAATKEGPVLVNSSRSILYASDGSDYAEAAADAAKSLRDALRT